MATDMDQLLVHHRDAVDKLLVFVSPGLVGVEMHRMSVLMVGTGEYTTGYVPNSVAAIEFATSATSAFSKRT